MSRAPAPLTRSPGAQRMQRNRERRRKRLRSITVDLHETEVDVLIRRGWLAADSRCDNAAVVRALYCFFDEALR